MFLEPPKSIEDKYPDQIVTGLIKSTQAEETDYNIFQQTDSAYEDEAQYFFQGYPSGDFLKQICIVMALWFKMDRFPVIF